jgi:spoIIIJ-associated protein
MRRVVATGKTVDEATRNALNQLQVRLEDVEVHVLQQPSRGFFGMFGARPAQVEVVVKESESSVDKLEDGLPEVSVGEEDVSPTELDELKARSRTLKPVAEAVQDAYNFLAQVLDAMGARDIKIESRQIEDRYEFHLYGKQIGIVIGKHGQTLDSLQYLVNLVVNKHAERYVRIVLDAEGYRKRRQETLENLADRLAAKAIRERKEIVLEPMTASERKIIHTRLQSRGDVRTQSRGEEPFRKIVIIPKVQ